MVGINKNWMLAGVLCLVACSQGTEEAVTPDAAVSPEAGSGQSWREERLAIGRETYDLACASCHDTGKLDAPLTGNPKDWSDRSQLWEAVLLEHAKKGYMEMPQKGGHPELSEDAVEAAAEYMLSVTFPELPQD